MGTGASYGSLPLDGNFPVGGVEVGKIANRVGAATISFRPKLAAFLLPDGRAPAAPAG